MTLCGLQQVGLVQVFEVGESVEGTVGNGGDMCAAETPAAFGGSASG